jgi:phosphate/phosphite/phosphonate ABC transporter binding protein
MVLKILNAMILFMILLKKRRNYISFSFLSAKKTCYNSVMKQSINNCDQDPLVFATSPGIRWDFIQLDEAVTQLQEHLSSLLGMTVKIVLSENYEDILAGLETGSIDFAKLGPYAFAQAQARFGARALVKAIDVVPDDAHPPYLYRSIIFTRADSGITHLSQIKKQKFGFVDRHSTTGYLIATFLLEQAGLDPEVDIEPVFLLSHQAVAAAVIKGEVVAGAIMEEEFMRATNEEGSFALRLLAMSRLLSRGPIVVRPDLPRSLERKLQLVLEQIHQSQLDSLQLLKRPSQRFVAAMQRERSLKTVAELAGVSYATVSRAINGRGRISPTTAARILKLVEELGYHPNAEARSLHKSRGELIGLLLPSLNYPHLDKIIDGIQEILNEVHMQLLLCPVSHGEHQKALQRQKAYFEMFSNSRFEGVLLTQWNTLDPTTLEILVRNGLPYILLEQSILDEGIKSTRKWFVERGHQQVGLITGQNSLLEPAITRQACQRLTGANFQFIETSTSPTDWPNLLSQKTDAPTAFLCTDDQTALHLRHTLDASNSHLPVLGIGNSSLAHWAGLPSLAFDGTRLGRSAALQLLKMLNIPPPAQNEELHFWVQANARHLIL